MRIRGDNISSSRNISHNIRNGRRNGNKTLFKFNHVSSHPNGVENMNDNHFKNDLTVLRPKFAAYTPNVWLTLDWGIDVENSHQQSPKLYCISTLKERWLVVSSTILQRAQREGKEKLLIFHCSSVGNLLLRNTTPYKI